MSSEEELSGNAAKIYKILCDGEKNATARSEFLLMQCGGGQGMDAHKALTKYIDNAGKAAEMAEWLAQMMKGPMQSEYIIDIVPRFGIQYAIVTNGRSQIHVPLQKEHTEGNDPLKPGDAVLVSVKGGFLVCRDHIVLASGNVSTIDNVLNEGRTAIIQAHDGSKVFHVSDQVRKDIKAGSRVIADETRNYITLVMPEVEDHGEAIATPIEILDAIDPSIYGDINPAADEILFRAKAFVDHPDWQDKLGIRSSCSYLFCGPTGTGKSTALKQIARQLADHVEQITGQRQSRLVMADATTFYTSYFGETEQRIKAWFNQLRKFGEHKLFDKQGNEVRVPLLVVIEEGEALFRSRGSSDASGHLFDRPLSMLLQQASSVAGEINSPIITIVTSNRPSLMDAAALRRFGMRRIAFSALTREQTRTVLSKQFSKKMPFADGMTRKQHLELIEEYLFENDPDQAVAMAKLGGGKTRPVNRSELVTPAIIEETISSVRDITLHESVRKGQLVGLDGVEVVKKMDDHFSNMAKMFTPDNLEEYVPHWFDTDGVSVQAVSACR